MSHPWIAHRTNSEALTSYSQHIVWVHMTTRNLDALFAPRALALLGASAQPGSVGNVVARNLLSGGFSGPVMFVNPRATEVLGHPCHASVSDLPNKPDLAFIATPPHLVPGLVAELGAMGCRAAVVITAGFGAVEKQAMLDAARPHLLRIVGPNCLGFLSPVSGINGSFSHMTPGAGGLALLSQSGAIATSMIDWACGHDIGFSHLVSLGDMADVDFGDLLDFLAMDAATRAILIYAESVTSARKFMSASRIAARAKPVIVVKAGRSDSGAKAAASHTGALAGADAVFDAAFRRAGMLRVDTLRDLFDAAETLDSGLRVHGDRLAIVTNGGGLGVLAADALEKHGGRLAQISNETRHFLDGKLPATWSRSNPVDIIGDADSARYTVALEALATDPANDAILVMNCPTGVADSQEAVTSTLAARSRHPERPMLGCWMGEATAAAPRRRLSRGGVSNYETPDEAVRAFLRLWEYGRNQQALYETPARTSTGREADRAGRAREIMDGALAECRSILTEPEAKAVLSIYGVPVVQTRTVATSEETQTAAAQMGGPLALKILSRQITHKSDVGGVRLDLETPAAVRQAADEMLERVARGRPDATIDGFTVQQMVRRPHAQELILGTVVDPTFGPCILFGHGGVATETIADRAIGLPPLNTMLARDMIGRTRVARLLAGYRDRKPADLEKVADVLIALSELIIDLPEIAELDINPLLADADGVIALDARIVVQPAAETPNRLAIRPWPKELARALALADRKIMVRPVRADDAGRLTDFASRTRADNLRMRFHGSVGVLNEARAARLCQIDYDREMVLVAQECEGDVSGLARLVFDPDFLSAECFVVVRSDAQAGGLGRLLLDNALTYASTRGARRVWGDILSDNTAVLDMARRLGGRLQPVPEHSGLTRVELSLV